MILMGLLAGSGLAAEQKMMGAGKTRPEAVYHNYCSVCHGDRGQGAVWAAGNMARPPRDFSTAAARQELTRAGMIAAVTHGKPGTAMAGFSTQLKPTDIETIVDYIRTAFMQLDTAGISGTSAHGGREKDPPPAIKADMSLPFPNALAGNRVRGKKFYLENCATCHGAKGDGQGPRAHFIRQKPRNFVDHASRQMFNRPALYAGIARGKTGAEMPAWDKVITAQEIADVAEYVFAEFIQPPAAVTAGKNAK